MSADQEVRASGPRPAGLVTVGKVCQVHRRCYVAYGYRDKREVPIGLGRTRKPYYGHVQHLGAGQWFAMLPGGNGGRRFTTRSAATSWLLEQDWPT